MSPGGPGLKSDNRYALAGSDDCIGGNVEHIAFAFRESRQYNPVPVSRNGGEPQLTCPARGKYFTSHGILLGDIRTNRVAVSRSISRWSLHLRRVRDPYLNVAERLIGLDARRVRHHRLSRELLGLFILPFEEETADIRQGL